MTLYFKTNHFQSLLLIVDKDIRQMNHTMSVMTDVGMKSLLQQECIRTDQNRNINPCLIQCNGPTASYLKYLYCAWNSDIEEKVASVITNMQLLLDHLVSYFPFQVYFLIYYKTSCYYTLHIGSNLKERFNMPQLDIHVTKRMSAILYYGDIVMNYVDNQLTNAKVILNRYQL